LIFNDIEGEHYDSWPFGREKLDTTAHYTRVATGTMAAIESPRDPLAKVERRRQRKPKAKPDTDAPPAE
jgi:hypothetical protein